MAVFAAQVGLSIRHRTLRGGADFFKRAPCGANLSGRLKLSLFIRGKFYEYDTIADCGVVRGLSLFNPLDNASFECLPPLGKTANRALTGPRWSRDAGPRGQITPWVKSLTLDGLYGIETTAHESNHSN